MNIVETRYTSILIVLGRNQGRASGGPEMVELGHPPGNETARSIPGKLAGNLNFSRFKSKMKKKSYF